MIYVTVSVHLDTNTAWLEIDLKTHFQNFSSNKYKMYIKDFVVYLEAPFIFIIR